MNATLERIRAGQRVVSDALADRVTAGAVDTAGAKETTGFTTSRTARRNGTSAARGPCVVKVTLAATDARQLATLDATPLKAETSAAIA